MLKKEIPIGTGRESEPEETLPAVEVQNKVIWVNPDFPELPFDIKEGEPTKLGLFLTPQPEEGEKIFDLKVLKHHKRSGLLGRAIFQDKQKRFYRDIDLKGTGYIEDNVVLAVRPHEEGGAYGILDREWAEHAVKMSEKFLKAGIRTERYIALTKLDEIVDPDGLRIFITEAKKRKKIPEEIEPVIGIRAFGTKHRIGDLNANARAMEFLLDAKKLVSQELGKDDARFSFKDYLKWFAETGGRNLGLMHKNGWRHCYVTTHNITLDCKIIDLDSVKVSSDFPPDKAVEQMEKERERDYDQFKLLVLQTSARLTNSEYVCSLGNKARSSDMKDPEVFVEIFEKAYEKALEEK